MDVFSITHTLELGFSGILYLGVFFPGLLICPLFQQPEGSWAVVCHDHLRYPGGELTTPQGGRQLWPLSAGLGTHETLGMLSASKPHTSLPERLLGLLNICRAGSFHWLIFTSVAILRTQGCVCIFETGGKTGTLALEREKALCQ